MILRGHICFPQLSRTYSCDRIDLSAAGLETYVISDAVFLKEPGTRKPYPVIIIPQNTYSTVSHFLRPFYFQANT